MAGEGGDGVGVGEEAVVAEVGGVALMVSLVLEGVNGWERLVLSGYMYRLAIAHAIKGDGPVAQFHEVRNLVAPAERYVWEAVD